MTGFVSRFVSYCTVHKTVAACILWPERCVLVDAKLPTRKPDVRERP